MKMLLLSLPLLMVMLPLFAQTHTPVRTHWSVSVHLGGTFGGMPAGLEKAMDAAGLGGRDLSSRREGLFQVGIEHAFGSQYFGKALLAGWKARNFGQGPIITYRMLTTAFLLGILTQDHVVRLAVGPALHSFNTESSNFFLSSYTHQKATQLGFGIETGLRFPSQSRFFIDIQGQYFYVGKVDIGTYPYLYAITPDGLITKYFNADGTASSYGTISVGVGIRVGSIGR